MYFDSLVEYTKIEDSRVHPNIIIFSQVFNPKKRDLGRVPFNFVVLCLCSVPPSNSNQQPIPWLLSSLGFHNKRVPQSLPKVLKILWKKRPIQWTNFRSQYTKLKKPKTHTPPPPLPLPWDLKTSVIQKTQTKAPKPKSSLNHHFPIFFFSL